MQSVLRDIFTVWIGMQNRWYEEEEEEEEKNIWNDELSTLALPQLFATAIRFSFFPRVRII